MKNGFGILKGDVFIVIAYCTCCNMYMDRWWNAIWLSGLINFNFIRISGNIILLELRVYDHLNCQHILLRIS